MANARTVTDILKEVFTEEDVDNQGALSVEALAKVLSGAQEKIKEELGEEAIKTPWSAEGVAVNAEGLVAWATVSATLAPTECSGY